jgi:hypothetical protein
MNDWPNYLIRTDFTGIGDQLAKIQLGEMDIINARLVTTALSTYGPEAERSLWNTQPDSNEFSLLGAEVLFNGLNKHSLPTFSIFKYALCISFPARSVAPCGRFYLCWNDPVVEVPAETTDSEE